MSDARALIAQLKAQRYGDQTLRLLMESAVAALESALARERSAFIAGYEWAEKVGDAVKRAEQAEARETALRERVQALQNDLDEERRAHDAIGTMCHQAGVANPDGTSVGAVKALRERVQALEQERRGVFRAGFLASPAQPGWSFEAEDCIAADREPSAWEAYAAITPPPTGGTA